MSPEQEIELVLRVLSTRPTDEEIFHLEHEDVNPRKVEQDPEEEPEEEPEEQPEEDPEEDPEEEPVPLPVPVGRHPVTLDGTVSSFKKFRTHETTSWLADQPTFRTWGCRAKQAIIGILASIGVPIDASGTCL